MGNISALSAAASGASAIASLGNTYSQYSSALSQGAFQNQMYQQNARMASLQGDAAWNAGVRDANLRSERAKQLIGRQRAVISSGAADVNTGSAAKVQEDAAAAAAADRATILNNAALSRWGFASEASQYQMQGKLAKSAGRYNANSSLISGGLGFARDAAAFGYYGKKAGWFDGKPQGDYDNRQDDYWTD